MKDLVAAAAAVAVAVDVAVAVAVAVAAYERAAVAAAIAFGNVVSVAAAVAVAASGTVVDVVIAAVNIAVERHVELVVADAAGVYYRDGLQRSKTCLKCVSKSLVHHSGQTGCLEIIDSPDSTGLPPGVEENPVVASCHSWTLRH